mgnify:CR=1 FL=1
MWFQAWRPDRYLDISCLFNRCDPYESFSLVISQHLIIPALHPAWHSRWGSWVFRWLFRLRSFISNFIRTGSTTLPLRTSSIHIRPPTSKARASTGVSGITSFDPDSVTVIVIIQNLLPIPPIPSISIGMEFPFRNFSCGMNTVFIWFFFNRNKISLLHYHIAFPSCQ